MKCRLLINDDLYHSGAGMSHLLGLTVLWCWFARCWCW